MRAEFNISGKKPSENYILLQNTFFRSSWNQNYIRHKAKIHKRAMQKIRNSELRVLSKSTTLVV